MQNNIIDDVNKIDETYLHIADKNVPYDQNRPDFGHDHNFVTADIASTKQLAYAPPIVL